MSKRKDIAQKRAQQAFEISKQKEQNKTFKAHVQKVPAMIRTNGLGNTLLFMKTGSDKAWKDLYGDISQWLKDQFEELSEAEDVLHKIIELDNAKLLRAMTEETLALFNWLRRFCKTENDQQNV